MLPSTITAATATAKLMRSLAIAFILSSACFTPSLRSDPPPNLAKLAALRETGNEKARGNYIYRQSVVIEEMDDRGARAGEYREVRDIIFAPSGERTEKFIEKP